jgi:choline dehydrogenase-like flavoprotein
MEMNCIEKDYKSRFETKFPQRRVTIGRTANLTAPVKGRGLCQYRNLCHRGCPYGAYFSTNASTLPAAFITGRLSLKTGALVNRVIYDEKFQRAKGVEIINLETGKVEEYYARLIFLNAATLATAFILLNSVSSRFPNGLGNSSDQVGRNLMDHHKTMGMSAVVEGFEDEYYYGRRPNGIYIPRFKNIHEKEKNYLRGFGLQGGAYRQRARINPNEIAIGADFKETICYAGTWSIGFTGFGECLPYAENRVSLNKDKKDKWGRYTLSVDAGFKENEKAMHQDILVSVKEILESAGYKKVEIEEGMSFPGNSNHEMGTARMGHDPKHSVLNGFNQMHEVKNIFITDGSFMVSSGCVNPSLTYMAMTARAVDYACREMGKHNI